MGKRRTTSTVVLPRNSVAMPIGVSANALGLGSGQGVGLRRLLFIGLPLTILLALVLGVVLLLHSLSAFTTKTVSNGAYDYSFVFYKKAEPVNLVQGEGLQYGNQAVAIVAPTTDNVAATCDQVGDQWKTAFTVSVEGTTQPVCTVNNKVFLLTFYHDQARHLFEITYTAPQGESVQPHIRKMFESVKVNLQ